MPLCLETVKNKQIIPLDKAVLLFGRHPDCDVVLSQSAKISRKHCCIMHVNANCVLRDLGSTNGVHLNGQRVKRTAVLKHGDQLAIGDIIFKVEAYTKPQGGNGAKPHVGSKKSVSRDAETPLPQSANSKAAEPNLSEISIPNFERPVVRDLSQEVPIAIPDEGDELYAQRSDPAFHDVADHGVPLGDDEESSLEAGGDSQVDVILLDEPESDDDRGHADDNEDDR